MVDVNTGCSVASCTTALHWCKMALIWIKAPLIYDHWKICPPSLNPRSWGGQHSCVWLPQVVHSTSGEPQQDSSCRAEVQRLLGEHNNTHRSEGTLYGTARANLKRHQGSQGCLQKEGPFPQQRLQTGVAGGSTTARVTPQCRRRPASKRLKASFSSPAEDFWINTISAVDRILFF